MDFLKKKIEDWFAVFTRPGAYSAPPELAAHSSGVQMSRGFQNVKILAL
jgi:hypothetical protein